MKRFAGTLVLGASLLILTGALPISAVTELHSEKGIDALTCATPPVEPAKRDTTKTKKSKSSEKKKKKSKKKDGEAKDTLVSNAG